FCESFKAHLYEDTTRIRSRDVLLLACGASAATQVLTNPIWLVKLRLQSQPHDAPDRYRGMSDAFRTIYKEEGLRGFWRGITPALIGTSHGAVQMTAYEKLKRMAIDYNAGQGRGMDATHYLLLGM